MTFANISAMPSYFKQSVNAALKLHLHGFVDFHQLSEYLTKLCDFKQRPHDFSMFKMSMRRSVWCSFIHSLTHTEMIAGVIFRGS